MKLIIAGGRDYVQTDFHRDFISSFLHCFYVEEVLSGGATGADAFGESLAYECNVPCTVHPANWKCFGKGAGPRRNELMAIEADAAIILPGGTGTRDMHERALKHKLITVVLP